MTAKTFFVTGTDTEIGKTYVTARLVERAQQLGYRAAAIKPIAAGIGSDGTNEDVARLIAVNRGVLPGRLVNCYTLAEPIAPHLAASHERKTVDLVQIAAQVDEAKERCDLLFVEGVGGWLVPLTDTETVADLAAHLGSAVILVVGIRLGCLNHALLTAQAIAARHLPFAGWIANQIDPTMAVFAENVATLQQWLPAPHLGTIPFGGDATGVGLALL